ncbi:cleavage stimulation factor subunit 2 tau variant [Brachionus plicatilis]|uniref:Cleavage stimulation factor subunit 2 tau variant n=1 Tax=Brachionus plicatilis TaxID=10195 RepID=A0A3M7SP57_BRAPC|nr:cleavage stimulation factor subunit 2 tau variant [Brachionus plicatilis]
MKKSSAKDLVLVAWQDSDVADIILDKSYGGKLATSNKENLAESKADFVSSKKKRQSRRVTIAPGKSGEEGVGILAKNDYAKPKSALAKLSNHFLLGSQSTNCDGTMNKTSNNRLDQSHRISYIEMANTLKTYTNPYTDTIESINQFYENNFFSEWFKLMNFGFNILVHGVGSKKALIQKFCQSYLDDFYFVELLGFHHDINTKNLLKNIVSEVLELGDAFKTPDEQLNAINQNLNSPLYLVIHNIDGNCLRDTSTQYSLSELASNKFIHILATVDHVNSSLLWDQVQNASFKWINFEVNTLEAYNDEIMFENSLMLSQQGNVQLSSMIHILKSLTQNAKNIFLIMVQHVLNKENTKKSITFSKLYHECREKFYVNNELTLRAQLTEFIDHKLIKLKTEADGYETIFLLITKINLFKLDKMSVEEKQARSVFVGNIPHGTTEEQMKDIFATVGTVLSFRIVYDRETGNPKGYGFAEYADIEMAQSAIRNLNGYEFNGRNLRVDKASSQADELRMIHQQTGGPPAENPYGENVSSEKAPEAISRAVASLPPEQMFELMKQMKLCIQNNLNEARTMLLNNPQLAYALLQAQVIMRIVDPKVASNLLHRKPEQIPPLVPSSATSIPLQPSMVRPSILGQGQPLLPNMMPLMTPLIQQTPTGVSNPPVRVSQPVVQQAPPVMDPRYQPRPSLPQARTPAPQLPVQPTQSSSSVSNENSSNVDQEKAALIMQVLQLTDDQIAMLPQEQRQSILMLKDQIAQSAGGLI